MAEQRNDEGGTAAVSGPSVAKLAIVVCVSAFVAALGAEVTAPVVTRLIFGPNAPAAVVPAAGGEALAVDPRTLPPPIYAPLDPPLVVSFADGEGRTRFVQLSLQAMSRDQKAVDRIRQHAPALRDAFLFLISKRDVDDLVSGDGKERLRDDMLAEAREIMRVASGEPSIEALYFTSFVVQ